MFADLHIHTCHSDGLLSVEEVIEEAIRAQVKVISITDHDSIEGLYEVEKIKAEREEKADRAEGIKKIEGESKIEGIERFEENSKGEEIVSIGKSEEKVAVIPGIELTVTNKLHILGYFINYKDRELQRELERMKLKKASWLVKLVKHLTPYYNITTSGLLKTYGEITVGSICSYLLECPVCNLTKKEIYDEIFWNKKGKLPLGRLPGFSGEKAIDMIKKAGGIAALAHPALLIDSKEDFKEELEQLIAWGLDGIEVYHISNEKSGLQEYFKEMAGDKRLAITGGSDFHGTKNKYTKVGEYGLSKEALKALTNRYFGIKI